MYRIIIVEDDRLIRKSLMKAPWEEHGFTIVGEAGNGEDAIAIITKEQPHVVVSDIHMPFTSGLEMAKLIKEKSSHTKIIFLTGFEDFNYAQEAVKLQVFDYLLKPIEISKLIGKVKLAAEEWEMDMQKEANYQASLPILQQNFLEKLKSNDTAEMDLEKELTDLDVYLPGPYYAVLLMQLTLEETLDEEVEQKLEEMITDEMLNLNTHDYGSQLMRSGRNEYALLLSLESDDSGIKLGIAQSILNEVDANMTITIGRTYQHIYDIGTSFIETYMAMGLKHVMGTGTVYSIDEVVPIETSEEDTLEHLDQKLEYHIELELPESVEKTLEEIKQTIIKSKTVPLAETRLLMIKYSTLIFYEVKKWEHEDKGGMDALSLYNSIMQMESLDTMVHLLKELISLWSTLMVQAQDQNWQTLVDQAMAYMEKNYHDAELTQQRVAEEVFVTAPYLSNLFKSEKGLNFSEYLLDLRMNYALKLLKDPSVSISQVADAVGYNNSQYFSVSFKKYTGDTPGTYRKRHTMKIS